MAPNAHTHCKNSQGIITARFYLLLSLKNPSPGRWHMHPTLWFTSHWCQSNPFIQKSEITKLIILTCWKIINTISHYYESLGMNDTIIPGMFDPTTSLCENTIQIWALDTYFYQNIIAINLNSLSMDIKS